MHASRYAGEGRLRRDAGMTLVEVMVALAIGLFLMIGAFTVYLHTRSTFQLTQTIARLQENGRFALDAIEPDIRMAHYWGLTTRTNKVQGKAAAGDTLSDLAASGDCGNNWSVNLDEAIGGTNNTYSWSCDAYGSGAQTNADTLVVRRADEEAASTLDADTLYIQSGRFQDALLFTNSTTIPSGYTASNSESHALVVDGYYVSQSSSLGADIPSLRVKHLVGVSGSGPTIEDDEIMPGVEDMQVQFGVDDDPPGAANRGSIDRYVNPGDAMLDPSSTDYDPNARVLAVRIWLRIRAVHPESGFKDDKSYVYAGRTVAAPNDAYRRIVVSKTIYIRNARPAT